MKKVILFFLLFVKVCTYAQNKEIIVSNINEYNAAIKKATSGSIIILKNGVWKDVHLKAFGKGTKENPIIVKAEKAGEVLITGDSKLQIYGEYVVVQGLWFKDGKPTSKTIVEFKKSSTELANNCRFTNNTISYFNPEDSSFKSKYVALWGKNNRVDHNNLTGKTNDGTTLVVWLKGEESIENNHLIDFNFFGPRPDLGKNGGETIRIGTSQNSMKSSNTIVENNTFKHCNGEVEIISNKSCDNVYRNNLFIESKGALTLRHGNNALVEGNVFLGNNEPQTGGIRIINEGHIIRNNLLIGLKGRGSRSPLTIMNGVPNSPLNRYNQVKNVNIQNNTLIGCSSMQFSFDKDEEKTLPPMTTIFANNLISNTDGTTIFRAEDDISGITFKNNITETSSSVDASLFSKKTINWSLLKSISIPSENNNSLISTYKDSKSPNVDIVGTNKEPYIVGAFNLNNTTYPKAFSTSVGPSWKPIIKTPKVTSKTITVEPGAGTIAKAVRKANGPTVLKLKDGNYTFLKELKINNKITIIGAKNSLIVSEKELKKPFKSFFKINSKAHLTLKNLNFDGSVNAMKYAIISPSKEESDLYNLYIDNCSFDSFKNIKGAVIKSYTNTVADTISILNSSFTNSFRGINFHSKKNTTQRVNAKNLIIKNTLFNNIEQFAVKYVSNNPDSNPIKLGKLIVYNCVFNAVNNTEKGKIISIKDILSADVKNTVFENSSKIINPIILRGIGNDISNCLINTCGQVKAYNGATRQYLHYTKPKWKDKELFIPSEKSILLKTNNTINDIGIIRK